jgi:hypothetical protein
MKNLEETAAEKLLRYLDSCIVELSTRVVALETGLKSIEQHLAEAERLTQQNMPEQSLIDRSTLP